MTDKIFNDAYKMAEDEIKKNEELKKQKELERVRDVIKDYKLDQLQRRENLKKQKEKIEEEIRAINLNLENLDKGNFEAIKDIIDKSEVAKKITPDWFLSSIPDFFFNGTSTSTFNPQWVKGVYKVFDEHNRLIKEYLF